jgi:hypothetical protein
MTASVPSLDEVLVQNVELHTGRRVKNLSVEVIGDEVVLRGRTNSFHIKQLAQHGVRAVLPHAPLRNAIVVD